MSIFQLLQLRHFFSAPLARVFAAVRKPAALPNLVQKRDGAPDRVKALGFLLRHLRDGLHQALRIRVLRIREDLPRIRFLYDLTKVHDDHAVTGFQYDGQIMRDENDARARLLFQLRDEAQDLRLNGHIEGGRRLVRNQHGGFTDQSDRDHDALAHAAGQLVRILGKALFIGGDPDQL